MGSCILEFSGRCKDIKIFCDLSDFLAAGNDWIERYSDELGAAPREQPIYGEQIT
jgi:hypothetical protein